MDTLFWEARWLNGAAPKEVAPNLYRQAGYKYRTVHKEVQNLKWVKNLRSINTE
jgi:hypothetical protein